MTAQQHRARHKTLHRALDELLADYIQGHPESKEVMSTPSGLS